jgi:cytochrome bd-type quinol oxidase subunit 1
MDWGFIIQIFLAVIGAALTVGGLVAFRAYRGSEKTMARPLAAASMAAGVVMLLVVGLTLPASSTTG